MPSTQYLQVPSTLPHRRQRSKSRQRSEATSVSVVTEPSSKRRVASPAPSPSPSPPATPAIEFRIKAQSKKQSIDTQDRHTLKEDGYFMTSPYTGKTAYTPALSISTPPRPSSPADDTPAPTTAINPQDLNGEMYTLEKCATPPPPMTLRERIIGAWKLESYIAYPTAASPIQRPTYPMTKNVTGYIMYTPDGYMSAQMLIPGQQSFKRGEGEEAQWAEAGKRFFAYCGPYYISAREDGEEMLRHTFRVCNLPGWIGDVQVRTWRFEENGEVLVLGSEDPTEIKGDRRVPVLKWRRARDNTHAEPPAPMPQIKISGPGEP